MAYSCSFQHEFTAIRIICYQPGEGPLGTDAMLGDVSDGQGGGVDFEHDAASVYSRLGGLDCLASIFSSRNIDPVNLHTMLGRAAPYVRSSTSSGIGLGGDCCSG